jgi:hypothetical protein
MIKIGSGFMGLLVYSPIKLWWHKHKIDDRNIDMIFIILLDNIYMGITS